MSKGYIYVIFATIFFSTMEIALKVVSNQFSPMQISFLRFAIGAVILLPFALKKLKDRNLTLRRQDYMYFLLTGFICVVVSMTFFQLALLFSKASVVAIVFSCNPLFIAPLAHYILKEKIYVSTVVTLVLSTLGLVCIINPFNLGSELKGIIFSLFAAFTFALYSVVGEVRREKYGGLVTTTFSFLTGSTLLLGWMALSWIPAIAAPLRSAGLGVFAAIPFLQGITLQNIWILAYVGVFVTGLGYVCFFMAMEATSATTASMVFFIKPALASVLAFLLIHEIITANVLLGMGFILVGSTLSLIANHRRQKQSISF